MCLPCLRLGVVCRWGVSASELGERLDLLVGDALLAAAVVNYLGPFPGESGVSLYFQQHFVMLGGGGLELQVL
jgi:hypothetical protein